MYLLSTVSSLELETFEQMALWQLVAAHSIPLSMLLSLLPKLKQDQHCEALTALMAMIKHERPNNDLMKALLSCPIESFISALLSHWSMESSTLLAQILANQFNSALNMNSLPGGLSSSNSPGKRKRTTMNSLSAATGFKVTPTPGSGIDSSIELMMTHMETLRTCLTANLLTKSKFFLSLNLDSTLNWFYLMLKFAFTLPRWKTTAGRDQSICSREHAASATTGATSM